MSNREDPRMQATSTQPALRCPSCGESRRVAADSRCQHPSNHGPIVVRNPRRALLTSAAMRDLAAIQAGRHPDLRAGPYRQLLEAGYIEGTQADYRLRPVTCTDRHGDLVQVGDRITVIDGFGGRDAIVTGIRPDLRAVNIGSQRAGIVDYEQANRLTGSVLSARVVVAK